MSKEVSFQPTREVIIKPYTTRELAILYGVNYKTFLNWIKPFKDEIGKKNGRFLTIPQVKVIFEKLDYPTLSVIKMRESGED